MRLILLPGMDGTGVLFGRLLRALPSDMAPIVIAYDAAPAQDYASLCAYVTDHLTQLLPKTEPFVLLGESFSGPIAVRLGSHFPNCRAVILAATFVRCPVRIPRWTQGFTGLLRHFRAPFFASRSLLLNGELDGALVRELTQALSRVSPAVIAARLAAVISVDARSALTQLSIPVLSIRAERDRLVGIGAERDIAKYGDRVSTLTLDAPHMVLQSRPVECARAIARFLSTTASHAAGGVRNVRESHR